MGLKTLINNLKSKDHGFSDYISFLIVLPILLIVIVGGSYVSQSIRVMGTIDHALQIVSENMTQNGALTTQGQDQLIAYIEKSGLDKSKIYLNATTTAQSYGSRGLEATIGYDFDIKAPGSSGVIWHKYYEQSLPIAQSQLIPGSGADNSGSVSISSVFAGIQGGTASGGSTSGSGASIQATSLTMTSNTTSPTANASVILSGKVYVGSNTAPAGTQIALNGGGVRQTVSTDSSGNYTANVAFSSQGSVTLQATSGVASASVTINVQPSIPATITIQVPTSIQIGNSFNITGQVVDASGNIVTDDTVVTISSSNAADIPPTNVNTKYGSLSYAVTKITSLDSFTITATAGSVSATESINVIPGKPESITLNVSPATVSAGSTITFSGKVLGPYGTPPAPSTPVKIISGTNVIDTMPSSVTDNQGTFSMTATLTKAGSHVFYAETTDSINSPTVTVAVTSSTPYKVNNLSQTPNPLNSGANLAISGSVSDEYDNPISSGTTLLITSSALPENVSTVVQNGTFNTHVTIQEPGIQTLTIANSSTNPLAGGNFTVTVLATSAFTLNPEQNLYTVSAGQSIGSVGFILKDSNGKPVAGKTVKFTETPQGDSLITPLTAVTDASGRVQTTVGTLIKAGTHTLMATLTDDPDVIGTVGITVNPGAPAIMLSTVAPSTTQVYTDANPVSLPIVFGTVTDSYANPVFGASVTVSGGYGANVTGSTNSNGYYALSVKPVNIGGPFALSFSITSIYGNYNTIQGNLTVTAPIVVPVDKVLAGTVIAGQTGTMPDKSGGVHVPALNAVVGVYSGGDPNNNAYLQPPKGYYDGSSWVKSPANDLISSNILGGKNILGVAGGITPHVGGAHTLSIAWWTGGGTNIYLCPPAGYYDGGTYTHWNEPNLVPGNIANGVTVLGVTGTFQGQPPIHGSQTWTTAGTYSFTVPSGVYSITAIITGGGGGGGGEGGGYHGGGGGAGGFGVVVNIPVTPGQVIPVTVGAGGALGQPYMSGPGWWSAPYAGSPGGSTSVGSAVVGGGNGGGSSNNELYLPIASGGSGAGYGQTGAPAPWRNDGGSWGYNHGLFYSAGGVGIGGGSGGTGSGDLYSYDWYGNITGPGNGCGSAGRAIIEW